MSCPRRIDRTSFSVAFLLQLFAYVFTTCLYPIISYLISRLTTGLVPLATLISATRRPSKEENVILSPDGFKRYFVAHGGLFSKDGITLDEIRKIQRIGRQPGTEGLMCTFLFTFATLRTIRLTCTYRRGSPILPFALGG